MAKKKLISEDPSQALRGGSSTRALFYRVYLWNFPIFREKKSSRGDLGQHLIEKLSRRC